MQKYHQIIVIVLLPCPMPRQRGLLYVHSTVNCSTSWLAISDKEQIIIKAFIDISKSNSPFHKQSHRSKKQRYSLQMFLCVSQSQVQLVSSVHLLELKNKRKV